MQKGNPHDLIAGRVPHHVGKYRNSLQTGGLFSLTAVLQAGLICLPILKRIGLCYSYIGLQSPQKDPRIRSIPTRLMEKFQLFLILIEGFLHHQHTARAMASCPE